MRKHIAQRSAGIPQALQEGVALIFDDSALANRLQPTPGVFFQQGTMPWLLELGTVLPAGRLPVLGLLLILSTVDAYSPLGLDKLDAAIVKFCRHVFLESHCTAMCHQAFIATTGETPSPEMEKILDFLGVCLTHLLEEAYRSYQKHQDRSWSFQEVLASFGRVLVESGLHEIGETLMDTATQTILTQCLHTPNPTIGKLVTTGADFGVVTVLDMLNPSVFQLLGIQDEE
jgi:hypothetical protein